MTRVVLLSGMNCTEELWAECGFDGALTPSLSEQTIDSQVVNLLAQLPERFVLVGLSLGANVAMALALAAPERLAGLCVISTNAKAPTYAQYGGWTRWRERLDAGDTPRELQESILPLLLSADGARRPDLVERTLAMGDATGSRRLRAQLRIQASRFDLRPGLAELAVPTLVISGESDAVCPPAFHEEIAATVPGAELARIPGGHLLPLEHPEAVGARIRSWMNTLAPVRTLV